MDQQGSVLSLQLYAGPDLAKVKSLICGFLEEKQDSGRSGCDVLQISSFKQNWQVSSWAERDLDSDHLFFLHVDLVLVSLIKRRHLSPILTCRQRLFPPMNHECTLQANVVDMKPACHKMWLFEQKYSEQTLTFCACIFSVNFSLTALKNTCRFCVKTVKMC